MDDMSSKKGKIWIDGSLVDWKDANVHILTHSLHYGTSAFEGIRSYGGRIFKPEEHFERLRFSAKYIGIDIVYSNKELIDISYKLLELNNLKDAYIRPLVYKGSETTRLNGKCSDHIMIAAWELKNYFDEVKFNHGIKITFSKYLQLSEKYAPMGTKVGGMYVLHLFAKNDIPKDCDDAIMMDEYGNVSECTTSNIFIVKDNIIKTPLPTSCLNGITRQSIIELAKKNNIQCEEKIISRDELLDADEVFIVGTAIEVMPVAQIDNKIFKERVMTMKINELFRRMVCEL